MVNEANIQYIQIYFNVIFNILQFKWDAITRK